MSAAACGSRLVPFLFFVSFALLLLLLLLPFTLRDVQELRTLARRIFDDRSWRTRH
jgi:hypothetical protein